MIKNTLFKLKSDDSHYIMGCQMSSCYYNVSYYGWTSPRSSYRKIHHIAYFCDDCGRRICCYENIDFVTNYG